MSLRPRYSLLTLLIFTALVAGGTWFWVKPSRYALELTPEWDWRYEHETFENDLHMAASSSARLGKGSLVYDARRTFSGHKQFLASKFHWQDPPLLARFMRPHSQREAYFLTSWPAHLAMQEIQAEAEHYGLTIVSTEKALCWVSSELKNMSIVQIEFPDCASGLCHVPAGHDAEARTSYLFTERGTIYQVNQRDEICDLTSVPLSQVSEPCRAMLLEELQKLQR